MNAAQLALEARAGWNSSEGLSAWQLIASGDATLVAIVSLSLAVSLAAVAIAVAIGLPLGAFKR